MSVHDLELCARGILLHISSSRKNVVRSRCYFSLDHNGPKGYLLRPSKPNTCLNADSELMWLSRKRKSKHASSHLRSNFQSLAYEYCFQQTIQTSTLLHAFAASQACASFLGDTLSLRRADSQKGETQISDPILHFTLFGTFFGSDMVNKKWSCLASKCQPSFREWLPRPVTRWW